ncbi:MAG: hypothetical protein J3R72DRAFT_458161 [Linnemannia gamsii]|nr:MAG: hypothetical protein J3R72DRAFT_458161 [Linnemannia gamsii]
METEYLNLVNKELHDIQQFFAHYYCSLDPSFSSPTTTTTPSILLPAQRTLTVLPLLKLPLTPPTSHSQDTLRESNIDASFDSSSTFSFSSSAPSSYSERDQYVSDLRDRYKQLKAVQDQMHLELTRARILRQSMLLPAVVTGDKEKENHVTCDDANPSSDSLQEGGGHSESTRQHEVSFTPRTLSVPAPESTPESTTSTTATTAPTYTSTPQTQPLFPDIRHLATKIYKSVPTRYILLALGLAVILGGWLDCDQDRLHKPVIQDRLHRPFYPQPPLEDVLRYPWPRH